MLAVRLAVNGRLYVIERVKRGIYSLSRLARWVHEGDVVVATKGWHAPQDAKMDIGADEKTCAVPDAQNWWQAAHIEEPSSDLGLGEDFAGLQVAVVFGQSEADGGQDEPTFVDVLEHRGQSLAPAARAPEAAFGLPDSQAVGGEAMDVDGIESNAVNTKQSPEELLNGMRDHYLQALYASKVRIMHFNCRELVLTLFTDIPGLLCQRSIDTLPHSFSKCWP